MNKPTFTVAIKAFNEEDWVGSAIRSVQAQTREDFELVVVDDGSTDATGEVVRGFQADPRIRLVSQENKGVSGALNAAIAAGSAPYLSLIDADDLWMPTYLEEMGRALDAEPGAGFAYTDAWSLDEASGRFMRQTSNTYVGAPDPPPADPETFLRLLIEVNFVFGLATIRRSAIDEVGGFNESLKACEDYEFWVRLVAHGYRAAHVPGQLAVVCNRVASLHTDERTMTFYNREVCRIAAEDLDSSEEVKALARARMARLDRSLAAFDGDAKAIAAWWALRRRLGVIRRAVLGNRVWYPGTPPGVAAAFPELAEPER